MTNREWLETLTDKELLKYLNSWCFNIKGDAKCPERLNCEKCQLNWLKQEHKED
nr:MAG TPA: hypothetical protein [Caudoviricetes sp.]